MLLDFCQTVNGQERLIDAIIEVAKIQTVIYRGGDVLGYVEELRTSKPCCHALIQTCISRSIDGVNPGCFILVPEWLTEAQTLVNFLKMNNRVAVVLKSIQVKGFKQCLSVARKCEDKDFMDRISDR